MDISDIRGSDDRTTDDYADISVEGTESARSRFETMKRRALESDESAIVRDRLGERMVDLTEEYFPAEVAQRRRKIAGVAFGAGVVVGAVGRSLLRR